MKYFVCAVYDSKSEVFSHVANFKRKEEAIRSFGIACNSVDSDFYKYAEDYSLFHIGMFDEEVGLHIPNSVPVLLIGALQASSAHKNHYFASANVGDKLTDMV